jgi:hypothetical protein
VLDVTFPPISPAKSQRLLTRTKAIGYYYYQASQPAGRNRRNQKLTALMFVLCLMAGSIGAMLASALIVHVGTQLASRIPPHRNRIDTLRQAARRVR